MRIHKSFVVNLKHIEFIEGNQVTIAQQALSVSPVNRDELLSRFSSL
jgi:DNA-binding LytR/AlgR family response regulator